MNTVPHNIEFRFPQGLARSLINRRALVTKYETNRVLKAFDFFTCLKATNVCGVISGFHSQLPMLLPLCKISRSSFYTRLNDCAKLGLLKLDGNNIRLHSWDNVCRLYDHEFTYYHKINYDLNNETANFQYFISALALHEQRVIITKQITKKFNQNPEVKKAHDTFAENFLTEVPEYSPASLHELQKFTYAQGAPVIFYDLLHKFNPDPHVTVKTIQKQFGFASHRSATYLKRNLAKRGLITVNKRTAIKHDYNNKEVLGAHKARKEKAYHTWYDPGTHSRTWHLTDEILINLEFIK